MAGSTDTERRRFQRGPLTAGWEVSCSRAHSAESRNLSLRLIDLSPAGASLETVGRLEDGLEVTLSLSALGGSDRFRALATVIWSQTVALEPSPRHFAGLRFVRVLEAQGDSFGFIAGAGASPAVPSDPRRRDKRFFPPGAAVEINTPDLWTRLGLRGKASTRLQDLSRGGVRIACSRELAPGTSVTIVIELLRPPVRLVAPGEVKWCRRDEADPKGRWNAGIAFRQVSPRDEEVLRTVDKFYLP